MPHRFVTAFVFCLALGPAPAAPTTSAKPKKEPASDDKKKETATDSHVVKRGETLWGIARFHGVSVGDLMDLNHLSDSTVRDGQTLKIPRPVSDPALSPAKATTHTISKGETFRGIARKYGLTQDDLQRANPKTDPAVLKAGVKLTIPATVSTVEKTDSPPVEPRTGSALSTGKRPPASGKQPKPAAGVDPDGTPGNAVAAADAKPKTRRYIVSADETAQTISEAFNISVGRLYEINGLKPGAPLKTGLEIQVPISPGEPAN